MATVDWAAIENPRAATPKRMFEGSNRKFYYEWVADTSKPKGDGTFEEKQVEMIMVEYPGADKTPVRITDQIREEYAAEYNAWKKGVEIPVTGTPLTKWSAMPRAVCEEMERFGFLTLEQLSSANDAAANKLGPLKSWVKKAKEFEKAANSDQAKVAALTEQLERQMTINAKLEQDNERLIKRIQEAGI
jgi:hypothetical protein